MILFKIDIIFHVFALCGGQIVGHILNDGALLAFVLHFGGHSHGESAGGGVDLLQDAGELASVGSEHFHLVAYVLEILLQHFEGGGEAGRTYLKFIIFYIAVEHTLDAASDAGTSVDINTRGRVDLHHNSIGVRHGDVDQKYVGVGNSLKHRGSE